MEHPTAVCPLRQSPLSRQVQPTSLLAGWLNLTVSEPAICCAGAAASPAAAPQPAGPPTEEASPALPSSTPQDIPAAAQVRGAASSTCCAKAGGQPRDVAAQGKARPEQRSSSRQPKHARTGSAKDSAQPKASSPGGADGSVALPAYGRSPPGGRQYVPANYLLNFHHQAPRAQVSCCTHQACSARRERSDG